MPYEKKFLREEILEEDIFVEFISPILPIIPENKFCNKYIIAKINYAKIQENNRFTIEKVTVSINVRR